MRRIALLALLTVWFALPGCVTTSLEQGFWAGRSAFLEAQRGYNNFLEYDNAQVVACYASHPEAAGDALRAICPPVLDVAERDRALGITRQAQAEFIAMDAALESGTAGAQLVSESLGRLEVLSIQLLILYGGGGR